MRVLPGRSWSAFRPSPGRLYWPSARVEVNCAVRHWVPLVRSGPRSAFALVPYGPLHAVRFKHRIVAPVCVELACGHLAGAVGAPERGVCGFFGFVFAFDEVGQDRNYLRCQVRAHHGVPYDTKARNRLGVRAVALVRRVICRRHFKFGFLHTLNQVQHGVD